MTVRRTSPTRFDPTAITGGRRDRRKRETRDLVESVALGLFERQGFRATTVDEIAHGAGIAARTFFRHYRSKEDVLFGWYGEAVEHLDAIVLVPGTPSVVLRQLQRAVDDFLGSVEARSDAARTFLRFQRVIATDPGLREAEHLQIAPLAGVLVDGVTEALGPHASPLATRMVLETFGACLRSALGAWSAGVDGDTRELVELHRRTGELLAELAHD